MSTTTVTGNLGGDANIKYTPSGAPVLEMSIAETPRRKTDQGWEDAGPTTWYRASLWGPLAEAVANAGIANKGARVNVTGTLTPRPYTKDGVERISFDVRVDSIGFPENRAQRSGGNGGGPSRQQADPWATDGGGYDQVAPF